MRYTIRHGTKVLLAVHTNSGAEILNEMLLPIDMGVFYHVW